MRGQILSFYFEALIAGVVGAAPATEEVLRNTSCKGSDTTSTKLTSEPVSIDR